MGPYKAKQHTSESGVLFCFRLVGETSSERMGTLARVGLCKKLVEDYCQLFFQLRAVKSFANHIAIFVN